MSKDLTEKGSCGIQAKATRGAAAISGIQARATRRVSSDQKGNFKTWSNEEV